jgi:hypothetical protein
MSPYVSLAIVRPNSRATLYAQDLRPPGGTQTWTVAVATDQKRANVTVAWPDIQKLPRNYAAILTDPVSGQTIDMRNQSSYQFNSGTAAATRSFTVTVEPTSVRGRALITNIVVNPSRSGGRSLGIYNIQYTLSRDAQVQASILNFGGRTLGQIGGTRAVPSGDNALVWNGQDGEGRAVPAGSYVIQLRAIAPDGEVTRQVVPLIVTGR